MSALGTQRTPTCSNMVSDYGSRDGDMLLLDASVERTLPPRPPAFRYMPPGCAHSARADPTDGRPFRFRLNRPAGHLHQHSQGFDHGALPHRAAADGAKAALAMRDAPVTRGDGEVHQTHRLARHRSTGACDTRDRHRKIDA